MIVTARINARGVINSPGININSHVLTVHMDMAFINEGRILKSTFDDERAVVHDA